MIPRPGLRNHLPDPEAGMQDIDTPTEPPEPASMSPSDRSREVAGILARGYLRHRTAAALSHRQPENSLAGPWDQVPPCSSGELPKRGRARKEVRE